ncbi:MAG: hypothetical protein Q8N12_08750 [Thermodesulfovibrionales bacterium]|nr:hypothetical protein [Nitrospinota bacterium]MCG2709618.1 hypothetical protein [Thermodesulfovibrionales bacterium]MCG2813870.1 hypothetical protein [Thermodesulfovibrionales bacterium]MDP3049493.1 hypothetical protein [Thermodesulfovibrionales bacterium]
MHPSIKEKHYSETTRKLHLPCPYAEETGIHIHVVIKDGNCYRSEQCMALKCKFNRLQSDIKTILSLTW